MNDNNKNKPRPHAEIILAWASGAEIQWRRKGGKWFDCPNPSWCPNNEYRIKPEPWKPNHKETYFFVNTDGSTGFSSWNDTPLDNGRYKSGNYFKTSKLAKEAASKIKELLKHLDHE